MNKHLRATFLPYNYRRLMYQRLQNLRQGARSVKDNTMKFYQLLERNEVYEIVDQMARYISGLRVQIQETVNLFDPISVLAVHQRALQIEKQLGRRFSGGLLTNIGSSIGGVSRATSSSSPGQRASGSVPGQHAPPNVTQASKATSSGMRCFGCGETGHRQADCKKQGKKALFVDLDDYEE